MALTAWGQPQSRTTARSKEGGSRGRAANTKGEGATVRLRKEHPEKLEALTRSSVVHLDKRRKYLHGLEVTYSENEKAALERAVERSIVKAAQVHKKAIEITATTKRLSVTQFNTEWNKAGKEKEKEKREASQLALMHGQRAWHKTAMRLVFSKEIDLFFTHNNKARKLSDVKKSIVEMLKEASKMEIPNKPPAMLAKLVSLPVVGGRTPDRDALEKEFAERVQSVDVEAIAAAAKARRAAGASARSSTALGRLSEYAEVTMPAIGPALIERRISMKFNTGWAEGAVLEVSDGTAAHQFDGKDRRQKKGIVPLGWAFAHFFDDELDWWVCLAEMTDDGKYHLFNGNRQGA